MGAVAKKNGDLRPRISAEATRLFAAKGYAGVSVREIAIACDCTKPAVYYYFGSKEGLFESVVREHLDACSKAIESLNQGVGTARERIHRTLDLFSNWSLSDPDAMRLLLRIRNHTEREAPEVDVEAVHSLHMQLIADAIRRGVVKGEIRPDVEPLELSLIHI